MKSKVIAQSDGQGYGQCQLKAFNFQEALIYVKIVICGSIFSLRFIGIILIKFNFFYLKNFS